MSEERTLTNPMKAEMERDVLSPFLAVFGDFPSGPVRFWSGGGELSFGGHVYEGVGDFMSLGEIQETVETAARGISVSLSGIPKESLDIAELDEYQGRDAYLYLGCLNSSGGVVSEPYLLFRGTMDTDTVRDNGKTASIKINAENRLATLLIKREYRATEESHHTLQGASTDRFFQFVASLQDVQIQWGKTP